MTAMRCSRVWGANTFARRAYQNTRPLTRTARTLFNTADAMFFYGHNHHAVINDTDSPSLWFRQTHLVMQPRPTHAMNHSMSHVGNNISETYPRRIWQGPNEASCMLGSMLSSWMGLPNPAWVSLGNVVSHLGYERYSIWDATHHPSSLHLGHERLKSQSKMRMSSFVHPSQIFVWGA